MDAAGRESYAGKGHSGLNRKGSGKANSPGRGSVEKGEETAAKAADEIKAKTAAGEAGAVPESGAAKEPVGPSAAETSAPDPAAENTGKEDDTAGEEPKVSETDVLKIYLQKSLDEIRRLKGEMEEARKDRDSFEAQLQQLTSRLASVVSEYENYRRRTAAEKESIRDDAVAEAVTALLPALDSLERAMDFADANPDSFRQGVGMTLRQLSDGFKKLGVTEIEAESQPFDPQQHNAVMHVEDESLGDSVVAQVFQKGYRIGDRVIRHSMVKVAN